MLMVLVQVSNPPSNKYIAKDSHSYSPHSSPPPPNFHHNYIEAK